jgi:hypothetical protein
VSSSTKSRMRSIENSQADASPPQTFHVLGRAYCLAPYAMRWTSQANIRVFYGVSRCTTNARSLDISHTSHDFRSRMPTALPFQFWFGSLLKPATHSRAERLAVRARRWCIREAKTSLACAASGVLLHLSSGYIRTIRRLIFYPYIERKCQVLRFHC